MYCSRIWFLVATGALLLAPAGMATAQRLNDDRVTEVAVPPIDRPNQIALRDLASRLGVSLRAAADGRLVVADVHPDSQAAALDVRVGDILTSVERQAVTAETLAVNIIAADNPEKKIALTFARDGRPIAVTTAFPDRVTRVIPAPATPVRAANVTLFGLTAVENAQGQVVVVGVAPGSAAALAGVAPDDVLLQVNDAGVPSLQRFAAVSAAVSRASMPGDTVTIEALRRGSEQTFVLVLRETDFVAVRAPIPAPTVDVVPGAVAPAVAQVELEPEAVFPASPRPNVAITPNAPAARVDQAVPPVPEAAEANPNERVVFCMRLRQLANGTVVVTDVMRESPAAVAGIKPGDALVSIAGERVGSLAEVAEIISRQQEGAVVQFGVARANQLGEVQVKMLPCEYRTPAASRNATPTTVDELSAEVRALESRISELEQAIKTLTTAIQSLQNPE